jgi:predicted kinase
MIFLMRATTCSGKSTFIAQNFPNSNAVFSSDDFREMLTGDRTNQQFNKRVFEIMHSIIDFRLHNRAEYTVYDATNLRIRDASMMIELSKKHQIPLTVISIEPPTLDELIRRNRIRNNETGFNVPQNVIEKHLHRYYECMDPFLEESKNNLLFKFIEINQDHEVIREV